ncbi:hypothetical protein WA026_023259 [Henosepilachna vigintioctopunctata]|uniref:Kazal-like domain-containing protein n=1 Tax=Henosepilachna vigintioctopunctata TaxID=420089 RepID=A0AAW1V5G6_9CUCU
MIKQTILIFFALSIVATTATGIFSNEGVYSGDERLRDPKIKNCMQQCPVTANLWPVCADDGKTYVNIASLNCLDSCLEPLGQRVKKVSDGFCINDLPPNQRPTTRAPIPRV